MRIAFANARVPSAPPGGGGTPMAWSTTDQQGGWSLTNNNRMATTLYGAENLIRSNVAFPNGAKSYIEIGAANGAVAWGISRAVPWANNWDVDTILSWWPNDGVYLPDGVTRLNTFLVRTGVIQLCMDHAAGKAWSRYGTNNWNDISGANPATNTGGATIPPGNGLLLWAVGYNGGDNIGPINGGQVAFTQTPPSGFTGPG